MTAYSDSPLAPMVRKLQLWKKLDEGDRQALLGLPHKVERVPAGRYVVRDGDQPKTMCLLVNGFAFRQKVTGNGGRSIIAFHFAGDLLDLQNALLETADHSVQTLTQATVAFIPLKSVVRVALEHPQVGLAMWHDTLVDASVFREWIANTTRRSAPVRLSHTLCEIGIRLESLGLAQRDDFEMPMSQEQFADATGLTSVHVNRTLKELEGRGLFRRTNRRLQVPDWPRLAEVADFNMDYLHLGQRNHAPANLFDFSAIRAGL